MALWRAETALQGADDVLTLAQRSQGALGIGPQRPARAAALLRQAQLRQVLQTPDQQGAVPEAAEVAGDLAQVDYTVTGGGGQGAVEAGPAVLRGLAQPAALDPTVGTRGEPVSGQLRSTGAQFAAAVLAGDDPVLSTGVLAGHSAGGGRGVGAPRVDG